ncbi:MAG: hypothetical protein ABI655_05150 [Phenylobacterium sp.]
MVDASWWGRWDAEMQAETVSAEAIAHMRAKPRFHDAMQNALRGISGHNADHPAFRRLVADLGILVLGVIALYLDATGGLTHRRLRDLAGSGGMLSAGRASALLMRMQMIGWVAAVRDHPRGAAKLYRPTPQMIAAFQTRYRLELESIQMMAPDAAELLARYDQPEGFRAFMAEYGGAMLRGLARPRPPVNALMAIGNRRGGALVLAALGDAASEAAGYFPAPGPVKVSVAAFARRFGVSRTHVVSILREAAAAGFYRPGGVTEGEGEVLPTLAEAASHLYAEGFISVAGCAYRALGDRAAVAAA